MKRDILLKEGACYRHKKYPYVYKKVTNVEKQQCIHLCVKEKYLHYSNPSIIHFLEDFVPISEEEFNEKMNEFLTRIKNSYETV